MPASFAAVRALIFAMHTRDTTFTITEGAIGDDESRTCHNAFRCACFSGDCSPAFTRNTLVRATYALRHIGPRQHNTFRLHACCAPRACIDIRIGTHIC